MRQSLSFLLPLPTLLLLGCGPDLVMATGDGAMGSTTEITPMTTSGTTLASTSEGPAADSSGGTTSTSGSFLDEPDVGSGSLECDVYMQDCPPGFKCMPWANDGGGSWNEHRCFPIPDDPVGVGEACTVEGSGVSGIDNCQLGAMCWDVDPRTNEGYCTSLCSGTSDFPLCDDPETVCVIASDGVIVLCLSTCNPLTQDCPEEQACYPTNDRWACMPDASGEMGAYGDPCESINVCDPGLICLGSDAVPDCAGSGGCCSEVCDLSSREGDAQCSGAPQGQICVPWYNDPPPPRYEDVGVCALPS